MDTININDLRSQTRGAVITADDAGYDEARSVHNGMFDRRPKVIVQAEQVSDVIAAVLFARENTLEVAVRGGGHSAPGYGTVDNGLVIDLGPMRTVRVDPAKQTARCGCGATWADFNAATHVFGLATPGGIISTTGVAGLTLGEGIGYLSRRYGLSCDNLLSADVVTAEGKTLVASKDAHADLFWALRGAGSNFGVVTSMEFQLHPVKTVYAGPIFYDAEHAGDLFRMFREFILTAPEAFGGFLGWQIAPPLPFIPEDRVGKTHVVAVVHWPGPIDEAEKVLKPFREVAPIMAQHVGQMPYPALNAAFDPLYPKGLRSYWKGSFAREVPDEAINAHVEHGVNVPEISATMHLYTINGACHRVGAEETAFPYRDAIYAPVYVAAWSDRTLDDSRIAWVRDYYQATKPYSEPAGYINFMSGDDQVNIKSNYRQNYDRLVKVKKTYDPDNFFHLNQNIVP